MKEDLKEVDMSNRKSSDWHQTLYQCNSFPHPKPPNRISASNKVQDIVLALLTHWVLRCPGALLELNPGPEMTSLPLRFSQATQSISLKVGKTYLHHHPNSSLEEFCQELLTVKHNKSGYFQNINHFPCAHCTLCKSPEALTEMMQKSLGQP